MADKKSNLLSYLLWLALLCYGCSGDGGRDEFPSYKISFALSSEITTEVEARSVINGSSLPQGDTVGIFAYSYSNLLEWPDVPDIYDNEPGIIGLYSAGVRNSPVTLTEKIYTTDSHAFYSYYPYRSGISLDKREITSDLMNDLEPDGSQTDWMWYSETGVLASPYPVRLRYDHVMALVHLMIGRTADVNVELNLENITIETAESQKFIFNIQSGVVTMQSGGATSYSVSPKPTEGTTFIVPPLDNDKKPTETAAQILVLPSSEIKALSLNINGEMYTTPSDWKGFIAPKAGIFRIVNITLGVSDITIQLGGQDWGQGGDTDVTQKEIIITLGQQGWNYDPLTDYDLMTSTVVINIGVQGWKENPETVTNVTQSDAGINTGKQDWKDHKTITDLTGT